MNLSDITPLILTYNESLNISRILSSLRWASQIVVIDSYSDDETFKLASDFQNVRVVSRRFDDHTNQWNFGLDQIETPWVLTLDADYICPAELPAELQRSAGHLGVYFAHFRYCILGKTLRGTLYPPRAVLFNPRRHRYVQDGHTQRLDIKNTSAGFLGAYFLHDDRKPLSAWCSSQGRYAQLEVIKLATTPQTELGWKDRLRGWYILAPILTFFYCLFVKCLILDGLAGWYYTMQRVYAEWLLGMTLLDRKLRTRLSGNEECILTSLPPCRHETLSSSE